MEFKGLGNSQTQLPEIGFGTWNYAGGTGPLRAVIGQGPCLIDTAETYGTESIVGEAIRGLRQRVFLATKARPRNFRWLDLIAAAERSLQRLGTDYIDLYQLHWPNETVPIEETMQGMAELVNTGKVRFIGVSNFSARALRKAQAALQKLSPKYSIVSNQVQYSLIERTIERELLTYCQKNSVTILAFSPLGSGLSRIQAADPERVLARVASLAGKTEAQAALNWVISKEGVIALSKASTAERVTENSGASGWRLPPDAIELLDKKIRFRRRGTVESAVRRLGRMSFQIMGKDL
jgi:diketogulonate reductase-like aldo/keto reductase